MVQPFLPSARIYDETNKATYVSELDSYIDTEIVNIVQKLNEMGYSTEHSCSGTISGHFDTEKFSQLVSEESVPDEIVKGIYISFVPQFHTYFENKGYVAVEDEFYTLQSILDDRLRYVIYDTELFQSSPVVLNSISSGFRLTGQPGYEDLSYRFGIYSSGLNQLLQNLEYNWQLFDNILEVVFELYELKLEYPYAFRYFEFHISVQSESIKVTVTVPELPDNYSFTGTIKQTETGQVILIGDLTEIAEVICESTSTEYQELLEDQIITGSPQGFGSL